MLDWLLGNKGQNTAMVGSVLALVIIATLLLVGNIVYEKIQDSMASSVPASGQAVNGNITSNTRDAFSLAAITPLILGATLILGVILGFSAAVSRGG